MDYNGVKYLLQQIFLVDRGSQTMKKRSQGITVMEVLVVLLVLGVLVVATIPTMTDYFLKARTISAAEALYHDFQKIRTEAIQQGLAATVIFQTGSAWCYGATTGTTCDCATAGSCTLGQTNHTAYKNTTLSLKNFASGALTFRASRGDVNQAGAAILTSTGGHSITVEVNKMGFPKICSSGLGGYQPCT